MTDTPLTVVSIPGGYQSTWSQADVALLLTDELRRIVGQAKSSATRLPDAEGLELVVSDDWPGGASFHLVWDNEEAVTCVLAWAEQGWQRAVSCITDARDEWSGNLPVVMVGPVVEFGLAQIPELPSMLAAIAWTMIESSDQGAPDAIALEDGA